MTGKLRITPAHGDAYEVQTNVSDRLKFEATLKKNKAKWGEIRDNVLKLNIFLGWSAATRLGLTEQTWHEFSEGDDCVLDVQAVRDEDDHEEDELGPLVEDEALGKGMPPEASITSL